jgi:xanthine dehydrogenase small subunit
MNHWQETGTTPQTVISTLDVDVMGQVTGQSDQVRIGASVSLRRVFQLLIQQYPELEEYFRRFASPAINAVATLAGNLQTASPIGDMIPLMVVLGASVELASATSVRSIPVEKFYRGYRTTDIGPDEVITAVLVPERRPGKHVFAYKVAKRFDQDISTLTLVAALAIGDSTVDEAAICYGGMSAMVHRASQTEAALIGRVFDNASVEAACLSLEQDYSPISDLRGSSGYRRQVAANLLRKSVIDYNGNEPTSIWQISRQ